MVRRLVYKKGYEKELSIINRIKKIRDVLDNKISNSNTKQKLPIFNKINKTKINDIER